MSFLRLTISYVSFINQTESVSLKERKVYLNIGLVSFLVLAVFYIYLSGLIVTKNVAREKYLIALEENSDKLQEMESIFIKNNPGSSFESLLGAGYENPKTLDILKRTSDVAQTHKEFIF